MVYTQSASNFTVPAVPAADIMLGWNVPDELCTVPLFLQIETGPLADLYADQIHRGSGHTIEVMFFLYIAVLIFG